MAVYTRNLYSFDYPEFKADICVTGWTWVPCPTWSNPGRVCKQEIQTPCMKTRTSRFRVYVEVVYPENLEEFVKREIDRCHIIASGIATDVIYTAATASSVVGPEATITAAIAAIPAAAKAYGNSFWNCLSTFSLSDAVKRQINASLNHDTAKINDWH